MDSGGSGGAAIFVPKHLLDEMVASCCLMTDLALEDQTITYTLDLCVIGVL